MPPLIESDEVVDALEVYDGDVIEHPTLGGPMTIAAHTALFLLAVYWVTRLAVRHETRRSAPRDPVGPRDR
jgi:hypothetical protein